MSEASRGIIFYNYGTGCLARLAVSLYTLRLHYSGSVTVLSDGAESNEGLKPFASDARLAVDVLDCDFNVREGRNHHYLSKCRLHEYTPYDVSLFLDSDTLVTGDLTPLLPLAEQNGFVVTQFSNWVTSGRTIARRIGEWKEILPRDIASAMRFGPAVNTGVMAFRRDAAIFKDWFRVARRGRGFFIPDETSCQVILHRYPHHVAPWFYNASCRYDDCSDPRVRLVHYHGRKHCRPGLPFHGERWAKAYGVVVAEDVAEIRSWTPAGDRHLAKHLKRG